MPTKPLFVDEIEPAQSTEPAQPAMARGPQWSLRTLLIVVAAVCFLLACTADYIRRALDESRALNLFLSRGGTVPEDDYGTIGALGLDGSRVTDSDLKELRHFDRLVCLSLAGTGITDEGVQNLPELPLLCYLDLSDTEITDASVDRLCQIRHLHTLYVARTNISAQGADRLRAKVDEFAWSPRK